MAKRLNESAARVDAGGKSRRRVNWEAKWFSGVPPRGLFSWQQVEYIRPVRVHRFLRCVVGTGSFDCTDLGRRLQARSNLERSNFGNESD